MKLRLIHLTALAVSLGAAVAANAAVVDVPVPVDDEEAAGLRRRANNGNGVGGGHGGKNGNGVGGGHGGNPFDDPDVDQQVPPSHTLNEILCHLIESEVDTPGVPEGDDSAPPNANGGGFTEYLCVTPASDEDGVSDLAYALDVDAGFVAEHGDKIRSGKACVSVSGSKSRSPKKGDKIVKNLAKKMRMVDCDPENGLGPRRKAHGLGRENNKGKSDKMLRSLSTGDENMDPFLPEADRQLLSVLEDPAPSVGDKSVLVLRVTALDASPTYSAAYIANSIFGPAVQGSDQVNLHAQMKACSHDQLRFLPASDSNYPNIVNGVAEVSISESVTGADRTSIRNAITAAAPAVVGDLERFDHVMYCFPPGTVSSDGSSWIANAYKPGWQSNYNDDWCTYPSGQMHEIGHNLGLSHSGEDSSTYGDQSGLMGYSYSDDETPRMCFNSAKSWQLGWYATHNAEVTPLRQFAWEGKLVGVDDYDKAIQGQHTIVLKVEEENDPFHNLYLIYNRKKGINIDTYEDSNDVTVTRGGTTTSSSNLNDGNTPYRVTNFDRGSHDLVVELCEKGTEAGSGGDVDYARVAVYLDDGNRVSTCSGTQMPTVSPAPTPAPISWFETIFDYEYRNHGNMFDMEAKDYDVDITEWWVSPNVGGNLQYRVFVREGTWIDHETNPNDWTLVGEGYANTEEDVPMALPSSIVGPSNPIRLKKNTRHGLYVTMSDNQMKYTKVNGASRGDLFREDDNVKLYIGTRTGGFPFATSISSSPYVVNTVFKYETVGEPCSSDDDCDDGNLCNGVRTCANSVCQPPTGIVDCDDDSVCTTDTCVPATGACSYSDVTCPDDGDSCTEGICDSVLGCQNQDISGCNHLLTASCSSCYINQGNFFDVEATGSDDIDIHTMTIKPYIDGTVIVRIYVRDGTWQGNQYNVGTSSSWTLAGEGSVDTDSWTAVTLPPSILSRANAIRVPANGGKRGILVLLDTPGSLLYTKMDPGAQGDLYTSDSNMNVYAGTRATGYPYPTSVSSSAYMYTGTISYDVVTASPTSAPTSSPESSSPTSGPTSSPESASPTSSPESAAPTSSPESGAPTSSPSTSAPTGAPATAPPTLGPVESFFLNDSPPYCSSDSPCPLCTGDCDHDGQCVDGGVELVCFERNDTTAVPGCQGSGERGKDYCYRVEYAPANQLLYKGESGCSGAGSCVDPFPLDECQGDCDSDNQCAGNLKCAVRVNLEEVPGCYGLGVRKKDYCYDPTKCVPNGGTCSSTTNDLCCSGRCKGNGKCG